MLYTVTIVDDRNNQKLHGQSWDEVTDLFACSGHEYDTNDQCAACVQHDEILDGLAHTGAYAQRTIEYSEYYDGYVSCYIGVEKEV